MSTSVLEQVLEFKQQMESEQPVEPSVEPQAEPSVEPQAKTVKTYTYNRKGKTVTVKRSWKNMGSKQNKLKELNDYFDNNPDIDPKQTIQSLFKEYNATHDNKISYSTFYTHYAERFGSKYN